MKLIIGGAYQGKRQYAQEHYGEENIVADFHLMVLSLIESGIDPVQHTRDNLPHYRGSVILCEDISCGVVPVDPLMRKWREAVGHTLALLAKESDEVVRIFCGIGTRIK